MERIKPEWLSSEWIVVADPDPARFAAVAENLAAIGFPSERLRHAADAGRVLAELGEKRTAVVFIDEGIGTEGFRELHARLIGAFGEFGFFLFVIAEVATSDFVGFAAGARIDGIIFRPYADEEFRRRVADAFTMKWPNRMVGAPKARAEEGAAGAAEEEMFEKARLQETKHGRRDPLTPDGKVASIFGLRKVSHPAVNPGKASFAKVRLAFKVVARNGEALKKAFPIHALEVDEERATFECGSGEWESGDHLTIEADITHGEEAYVMRIEALAQGEAGSGMMTVTFDKGNRTRFEAAMKMVAKRFRELKDFFKYAKGA